MAIADEHSESIVATAERRFLFDAEFHAQVFMAMQLTEAAAGERLTPSGRDIAIRAASLALVVAETGAHIGASSDPPKSTTQGQL